jgi:hypothetical protein
MSCVIDHAPHNAASSSRRRRRPTVSMTAANAREPTIVAPQRHPARDAPLPVARTIATTTARIHHAVTSSMAAQRDAHRAKRRADRAVAR